MRSLLIFPFLFSFLLASEGEEALAFRRIADFWQEGEYQLAKSQMESFLQDFPQSQYADLLRSALGDLSFREKNYRIALQYYSEIADSNRKTLCYSNRMQCLYHLQWHSTLADECEIFLKNLPEDTSQTQKIEATYYLAIAQYSQCLDSTKTPESVQILAQNANLHFESLMSTEYADSIASAYAHILCLLKKYEEASKIYHSLAKNSPNSDELYFQVGIIQSKFDKDLAIQTFHELEKQKGAFCAESSYNRLVLCFDLEQYNEIVSNKLEFFQNISPDRINLVHFFLGRSLFALKRFSEATLEFQAFLESSPANESARLALLQLVDAAYEIKDITLFSTALLRLKQLDQNMPELPKAVLRYAQLLSEEEHRFEDALSELRSILPNFIQHPTYPQLLLEVASLEGKCKKYEVSRDNCLNFLRLFPNHELTNFAWRSFAAASSHLAIQSESGKQQLAADLKFLIEQSTCFSLPELCDWKFHLAKIDFEILEFEECRTILENLVQSDQIFEQKANAKILFALFYRDVLKDEKEFCTWAEIALQDQVTILSKPQIHLELFNSYISFSDWEKASHHLYDAFLGKSEIKHQNLLWLGTYLLEKGLIDESDSVFSALLENSSLPFITNETIYLETAIIKKSKILLIKKENSSAIKLLKLLDEQYRSSSQTAWNCISEARLLLGEAFTSLGELEIACSLFEEIASSSLLRDRFAVSAALQSARIKIKLHESIPEILSCLKDIVLQKNIYNEPLHFEAALDYINLQAPIDSKNHQKREELLNKMKSDFESQEDLLSREYHIARAKLPAQNQIYEDYIQYVDSQIFLALVAKESNESLRKDLITKTRDILFSLKNKNHDLDIRVEDDLEKMKEF